MNILTVLAIILVLTIYSLVCYYIGYNGWVWLKTTKLVKYKKAYISLIVLLAGSIFIERLWPFPVFGHLSGIWIAIFAFSVILLPITNIIYLMAKKRGKFGFGVAVLSVYVILFAVGTFNAWSPVVRTYDIEIAKKTKRDHLKILMASDFHLGSIVGNKHLERFLAIVEQENPDIVLLPGDIINDNIGPYIKNNMDKLMSKIDAPLGVYASLGNHDYYGNDTEKLLEEMDKIGITMLNDEFLLVEQDFYLAGRREHTDKNRQKITEFNRGIDSKKPIIMLDHQPRDLDEAREAGIDLLLSGHTHGGQIAPGNLITGMIYENDWGYLKNGDLHSIVSSGFGLWGPPLRIGTRAEAVMINVTFTK